MNRFLKRLTSGDVLILDGATGTYLQDKGLEPGQAPEAWNLSHPDVVQGMAAAYFASGSDLVETNTFGGNAFRLKHSGLDDRVRDVNRLAAELARSAAPEGGIVAGSIGPTGEFLAPLGLATPEALHDAFSLQAEMLAEGGVDLICVETMMALDEAVIAVRAAKEATGLPVMATMTFDEGPAGFATQMGVRIPQAVEGLAGAGADVVGANCGSGIDRIIRIVREMRPLTDLPILTQSNAGMPVLQEGRTVFPETPEEMAGRCRELVDAGANIVGGCCGTGPDHIAAMARAIRKA